MVACNNNKNRKAGLYTNQEDLERYDRLAALGKISVDIINKLYNPLDAINRFLNLTLYNIEEDSQGRQFLLESKLGLRRMSALLKRLNNHAKKMEKEINEISKSLK